MTVLSRRALFDLVWTRPLTDLADEFAISDVGLRKICDRHDIPTPGRGYWAQVKAGRRFPRPRLRPPKTAAMDEVRIAGARPLPPAVMAAMAQAKTAVRKPASGAKARPAPKAAAIDESTNAIEGAVEASVTPKVLAATAHALDRAREDAAGLIAVAGPTVIAMRISRLAQAAALGFLARLVEEAAARGWRLEAGEQAARLQIDGEGIDFRLDEIVDKIPHRSVEAAAAQKAADEDRPWRRHAPPPRQWDYRASGRLQLSIDENAYGGLRRTFSQRKGYAFVDALERVVSGFAGHAALKAERRREAAARARAAEIAEARRRRLEAFASREKRRADFIAEVHARLMERAQLEAVLAHLEAQGAEDGAKLASMAAWIRRRLSAIEARINPTSLDASARAAEIAFEEPPPDAKASYWRRDIALSIWAPAQEADMLTPVAELDWAIGQGWIKDPAEPAASADRGGTNGPAEKSL